MGGKTCAYKVLAAALGDLNQGKADIPASLGTGLLPQLAGSMEIMPGWVFGFVAIPGL